MGVKAKVTSKGQITIPKEVREDLGLRTGDEVEFIRENGAVRLRKEVNEAAFKKWRGYLKHLEGQRSDDVVEEMRGR